MRRRWLYLGAALLLASWLGGCKGGDEDEPVSPAPAVTGGRVGEAPTGMAGGDAPVAQGELADGAEPTAVGDASGVSSTPGGTEGGPETPPDGAPGPGEGSQPSGGPEPAKAPPKGDFAMTVRGVTYQLDKAPLAEDKLRQWKVPAYKGAQGATFTPGGPDMGPLAQSAVGMVIKEPPSKVQQFYQGKTKEWKDFRVWVREALAAMQPRGEGAAVPKALTAEDIDKNLPGWWRMSPDGFTLVGVIGDDAGKQTGVLVVHRDEGIAGAMMQMMSDGTTTKGGPPATKQTGSAAPPKGSRSNWRR